MTYIIQKFKGISRDYILILGLAILSFIIKIMILDPSCCFDNDELFSVTNAIKPMYYIINTLNQGNNPPLWELMLHFWFKLVPITEFWSRILPIIFSVITIIPIYLIGERFLSKNIGLMASLIFIFSNFCLYISFYCRVYSFLGCMAMFSMYFFFQYWNKLQFKYLIYLLLFNGLSLYSHYMIIPFVLLQSILLVYPSYISRNFKFILMYLLILVIIYIPQLPYFYIRFLDSGLKAAWIGDHSFLNIYNLIWKALNAPLAAVFALSISTFYGIFVLKRTVILANNFKILLINSILFWGILFVYSYKVNLFFDKYLYFSLPIFFIIIAKMLLDINSLFFNKKLYLPIILGLIMLCNFELNSNNLSYHDPKYNYRKLAKLMIQFQDRNPRYSFVLMDCKFIGAFQYYFQDVCTQMNISPQKYLHKIKFNPNASMNLDSTFCINWHVTSDNESFYKLKFDHFELVKRR